MQHAFIIDWDKMFSLDVSFFDLFIRGTLMYFFLFLVIQTMNRSQSGKMSNSNLLLIVLIADIAQNGIAGNYNSLTSGVILVLTVYFWSFAFNWLGYHFPFFQNLLTPPPIVLVRDGQIITENMRRALVTLNELHEQMRIEGIEDIKKIKLASIEADGSTSFLLKAQAKK